MRDVTFVLLSTYNGAAFLEDQLESLYAQSDKRWHLLWRDDGSDDTSVAIVERFTRRIGPERSHRLTWPEGRVGTTASFLSLLRAVPSDVARIAFCDQDDVWLPDKLARADAALNMIPDQKPALYCARQVLVDENLQKIGLSPKLHHHPDLSNALVQNIAVGNTVVLNAAALRVIKATKTPSVSTHDWLSYLIIIATGGNLIFDKNHVILYRQHKYNQFGSNKNRTLRIFYALRRGPDFFLRNLMKNYYSISDHPMLSCGAKNMLSLLGDLASPCPFVRLRAFRRSRLWRQKPIETFLLGVLVTLRAAPLNPSDLS